MNYKDILESIKSYWGKVKGFIKDTYKLPYAKLYLLLSIILFIVFLLFTFPYEAIIRKQLIKYEPSIGQSVTLGSTSINLIGDSYIENLGIIFRNNSEINMNDISFNVAFNPITLFLSRTLRGTINASDCKYYYNNTSASLQIQGDFKLKFSKDSQYPTDGFCNMELNNIRVKGITIKGFDIPPLRFSLLKGETSFKTNSLEIDSFTFSGPDLSGAVKGKIMLAQFIKASRLDLTIEIDSRSKIIENYSVLLGSLEKSGNNIIIPVVGTISSPSAKFPWNNKNSHIDKVDLHDKRILNRKDPFQKKVKASILKNEN